MQTSPSLHSDKTETIAAHKMLKQRYKLISLLGKGGMGAVYTAEDAQFGNRTIAIKEMSQSNLSLQEATTFAEQFKQEAHLLANLTHPNLPRIYDYFNEDGRWYLVMDFIRGMTLAEYLNKTARRVLPLKEALEISIQLAKVLDFLHKCSPPIIFRDLKPLNIMVTREENIYLIDFGIARLFKPGKAQDTVAYVSAGYAAPEQFGTAQTSPSSDIYSLGATLHQLLSGSDPKANTPLFAFKPLSVYNPNLPRNLVELVARMVQIDPAQRPASMAMVRQGLEHVRTSMAHPPTPLQQMQSAPRSRPTVSFADLDNEQRLPRYPSRAREPINISPRRSFPSTDRRSVQRFPAPSTQASSNPSLQRGKIWKTLLLGIINGLMFFIGDLYYYFFRYDSNTSNLTFVFFLLLPTLIVGFIIGKITVVRRAGFFTGFIALITYLSLRFVFNHTMIASIIDILSNIVLILFYGLFAGLVGLFGAWVATINHPYYKKRLS